MVDDEALSVDVRQLFTRYPPALARREFDLAREIMQAHEPYELVHNTGNGAGKEQYICQALRGHAICPLRRSRSSRRTRSL
ncbi:hypothetical protein Cde04nite_12650 [Cellulomonas denverensis]|nr:hypothetical protein Cde04nite_12650 [Cellulomonas denverensis]